MTTTQRALLATYGEWGTLYRRYLINYNKEKYYTLLSAGELYDYISEVNLKAERLYEETLRSIKASGSGAWNRKKESAEEQAREMVCKTLISWSNAN